MAVLCPKHLRPKPHSFVWYWCVVFSQLAGRATATAGTSWPGAKQNASAPSFRRLDSSPFESVTSSPFESVTGTGCYIEDYCIYSSRRRGSGTWMFDGCTVRIAPGAGPLIVREWGFPGGPSYGKVMVNDVQYWGVNRPYDVRPWGAIHWLINDLLEREDFTLCLPKPGDSTATPAPAPTPAPTPLLLSVTTPLPDPQPTMVVGVLNGVGGSFSHPTSASSKTLAFLACESANGKGNCVEGSCRCFKYFYRKGSLSCNCGKKPGEHEWVYENSGCIKAHEDYSPGIYRPDVPQVPSGAFVRRRETKCSEDSWTFVTAIGKQLLSYHTVLDLRAATYHPGSPTWDSLVGGVAAPVGTAFYDRDVKAFIFNGKVDGSDTIRVPFSASFGPLPEASFSAWVRITNPNAHSALVIMATSSQLPNGDRARTMSIPAAGSGWLHVVKTWTSGYYSKTQVYVNGVLASENKKEEGFHGTYDASLDALFIGGTDCTRCGKPSGTRGSYIWISDVQIFNKVMIGLEVVELYQAGRPSGFQSNSDERMCRFPDAPSALVPSLLHSMSAVRTTTKGCACRYKKWTYQGSPCTDYCCDFVLGVDWCYVRDRTCQGTFYGHCALDTVDRTGENHLNCLSFNAEDAAPELMEAITGSSTSCALLLASTNCSTEVIASEPLSRLCPRSCGLAVPTSTPGSWSEESQLTAWTAETGQCVSKGQCAKSPYFPLLGVGNQTCAMSASSTLHHPSLAHAELDSGLVVNGLDVEVFSSMSPAELGTGSTIAWSSSNFPSPPWMVCLEEVNTSACHDDANWTDTTYGDGSVTCDDFGLNPSWCFTRGPYSREAQQACPQTCRDCMEPFELMVNKTCAVSTVIDESQWQDQISSSWSCYWHCLSQKDCTHFEWVPETHCRRFSGCKEQQVSEAPEDGMPTFVYIIPNKVEKPLAPLETKLVWKGFVHLITSETCSTPIIQKSGCDAAARAMGLDVASWPDGDHEMREANCVYFPETKALRIWLADCTPTSYCLCPGRGVPLVGLQLNSPVTTYVFPTRDLAPLYGHPSFSLCTISQSTRCQGKVRTFRQMELTVRLGPGLAPFPVDWDGDGDTDLFLGRSSGELVYMENVDDVLAFSTAVGLPKTTSSGACSQYWENALEGSVEGSCSHWCCHSAYGDICYSPSGIDWVPCSSATAWGISASYGLFPLVIDWDSDGNKELLVASCDGTLAFWRKDGDKFQTVTGAGNPFGGISITGNVCSYPFVVDWDGDGDLDVLLGTESGRVEFYENLAGMLNLVQGELNPFNNIQVKGHAVPAAVDFDKDGDIDLILGNEDGTVEYYDRSAHGTLIFLYTFEGVKVEGKSIPRVADWDSDGDLDLILADGATGRVYIYVSYSEMNMIERTERANPFHDLEVGFMAVPQIVDWDNNGLSDLIVGRRDGRVDFYARAEDGSFRLAADSPFHNLTGLSTRLAQQMVDWDGDGDVDMLVGQDGGEILFYGQLDTGGFAPPETLVGNSSFRSSAATFMQAVPHAVDWDGDGDLDLLVGDSGEVLPRRLRFASFFEESLNVWFEEQPSSLTIGGREVYLGGIWALAYCSASDYWFIFEDSAELRRANELNECRDVKAKKPGEQLLDRGLLGQGQGWQMHGSLAFQQSAIAESAQHVSGQTKFSQGSVESPHCDICNRDAAECHTCSISTSLQFACAREFCSGLGFDTGMPRSLRAVPASLCACADNATSLDLFGASCAQYETKWCGGGWYDTAQFKADRDCCTCGGGQPSSGQGVTMYSVEAECLKIDIWVPNTLAAIAEVLPAPSMGGSIKFFERTPDGLEERFGVDNPFAAISTGFTPHPSVLDWNGDGRLDLVLGTESGEVETVTSTGSATRPLCAMPEGDACIWDEATQARCARALCRAAGFASGSWTSSTGQRTGSVCSSPITSWYDSTYIFLLAKDAVEMVTGNAATHIVTARCVQGGAVQYFEQQGDGTLMKMEGEKNALDVILRPLTAVPLPLDWDADGEWEVVLGDNSRYMRYYEFGRSCERPDPCYDKGICHPVLGVCDCIGGHVLGDCSRCDSSYYSRRAIQASLSSCIACPGLTTKEGLCAGRGHCFDDQSARETSSASNSTRSLEIGTGECKCNDYYFGNDGLGRSSCSEGACPPAMEPQLDASAKFACQHCRPGFSKAEEGNHACTVCPIGRFSGGRADSCEACPAGTFQQNEGQDFCNNCLPGSYSENASFTCPMCPIGRYADRAAQSKCSSCHPGQWSDDAGSQQCAPCPPGKYGSGLQPCQACDSGSYSELPGQSACTLCAPGRYSPAYEASTSEVCQPCDTGKFSSSLGAESQAKCLPCSPGATTAAVAAIDASLCIQPNKSNFSCVSGRHCTLSLTGNNLQSPHQVAIAYSSGEIVSSRTISAPSSDGVSYSWSQPVVLDGSSYQLLWCPGIHGTCGLPDFAFTVGALEVTGPAATTFTCIRGYPCVNLGPVSGISLLSADRVQSQASCGFGPPIAVTLANTLGYGSNTAVDESGAFSFGFGSEPVSVNPSTDYQVCWCAMERGQSAGCNTEADFLVALGVLTVEGPRTGHELTCFLGQDCMLAGIEGVNVAAGDRLMVLSSCGASGQAISGMPGEGIAESPDGTNFHFLPLETALTGDLRVVMSLPGLLRLCFCRPVAGVNCTSPKDFQADTGFFTSKGPYSDHQYGCFVGFTCNLPNLQGIGLQNYDELRVETGTDPCSWELRDDVEAKHAKIHVPSIILGDNKGSDFSLGHIQLNATPGKYRLCWRPSLAKNYAFPAFRLSAGFLFITCPSGTYRLARTDGIVCEDCPLGSYCVGGTAIGGFEDDTRTKCSAGATTTHKRSSSMADCLCDAGYFLSEGAVCAPCAVGRFKTMIADNTSCPGTCPEGLTTRPGARSADQCYSAAAAAVASSAAGTANISTASVFVLEGMLQMPACLPWEQEAEARRQLRQSIASSIGVAVADVQLDFPEVPSVACQLNQTSQGARRLQQMQSVVYKIFRASQSEADRLSQNVNAAEIQADMQSVLGITVTVVAPPSVSQQTINCTELGEGLAFLPGTRPISLAECTCSLGYHRSEEDNRCLRCGPGLFKATVGDVPCSVCPVFGELRMTTLAEGAVAESLCTCPPGYFAPEGSALPPENCLQCGTGHFCQGGKARESCPYGTTTRDNVSKNWEDCVCQPGFTRSANRNATHRCDPCVQGTYKVIVGDDMCSQRCRLFSTSDPGAASDKDCYCTADHAYSKYTDSCTRCPAEGVNCEGGFDPPESRNHKAPMSKDGFYLTGHMEAEQCLINDDNGESTCLAGATWEDSDKACSGYQTGLVCGACKIGSARDLGDEACTSCTETWHDWFQVFNLNADLVIKACFGIFLGKQAMDSASKTRKMEAVIIRILLQWITAGSVLSTFDLSAVNVFDWSQRAMEMNAASENGSVAAILTASGLSFRFQFPTWFLPVWRTITAITGSIPGPISPQFSMECLVQRQLDARPDGMPTMKQLLAPVLWWLFYPISVVMWVGILCVVIAKIIYPITIFMADRAKRKLKMRLLAAGVTSQTSEEAMNKMGTKKLQDIMKDPMCLTTTKGLVERCGGDVYAEAASRHLVDHAGSSIMEMLQSLTETQGVHPLVVTAAEQVLEGGLEFLRPFLIRVIRIIGRQKVSETFTDPLVITNVLFESLKDMDEAQAAGLDATTEAPKRVSRASGTERVDFADEEEFGEEAVPGKTMDCYVVFGLFQSTKLLTVLKDALPLYIVTLYSIWDVVTRRFMGVLQVRTLLVTLSRDDLGRDHREVQGRWLYDMRYIVFTGDHTVLAVIALFGLSVFSVGLILMLFMTLSKNKFHLQEKSMIRNFGYFYNGLEPNVYWWEVLVKKGDILCLYIITFTEVFHDPRAKLIVYLASAGIFWALHNMYHPYDDRMNMLADRIEDLGLCSRFMTIFILQVLLMMNARPLTNAVMAIAIVTVNAYFLCTVLFVLAIELPVTQQAQDEENTERKSSKKMPSLRKTNIKIASTQKLTDRAVAMMGGGSSNPVVRVFMRGVEIIVAKMISPIISKLVEIGAVLAFLKEITASKVPHVQWQGIGHDLLVITHEKEQLPWYERAFAFFVRRLYKLGDSEQKTFVARTIGQFWDHILNNSECHRLPHHIMDIFFVLPDCLRREKEVEKDGKKSSISFHVRVGRRVRLVLLDKRLSSTNGRLPAEAMKGQIHRVTSFKHTDLPDFTNGGEDFNAGLLFIQRLPRADVHEFLLEALMGSWDDDNDDGAREGNEQRRSEGNEQRRSDLFPMEL